MGDDRLVHTNPRDRLVTAASVLSLGGRDAIELTSAAAEALVAGVDSPRLRELAGLHRLTEPSDLRDVAMEAFKELGLEFPDWRTEEGALLALRGLCLRYRSGRMSGRELTRWASMNMAYESLSEARELGELGEAFDDFENGDDDWRSFTLEDMPQRIDEAVDRFLAT